MTNKKCEYCSFGNYGSFGFDYRNEHVKGLYGKPMEAKEDLLSDTKNCAYDTLKPVKSSKGYFIEATVTDTWEHETYRNYTKIGFCPVCGRKLSDDEAKKFFEDQSVNDLKEFAKKNGLKLIKCSDGYDFAEVDDGGN